MRSVLRAAILASALVAAAPAVAQVTSPGPVWHNQGGIPAPTHMRTGGPLIAGNPPHWNARQPRVSPNPPHFDQRHGGSRWGGSINGRGHGGMQGTGGG